MNKPGIDMPLLVHAALDINTVIVVNPKTGRLQLTHVPTQMVRIAQWGNKSLAQMSHDFARDCMRLSGALLG